MIRFPRNTHSHFRAKFPQNFNTFYILKSA